MNIPKPVILAEGMNGLPDTISFFYPISLYTYVHIHTHLAENRSPILAYYLKKEERRRVGEKEKVKMKMRKDNDTM